MRAVAVLLVSVGLVGAFGVTVGGADDRSGVAAGLPDLLYTSGAADAWFGGPFALISHSDGSYPVVAVTKSGLARDPSWSPDGASVAVIWEPDPNQPPYKLYIVKADGSSFTRPITDSLSQPDQSTPVWSPDGGTIAYLSTASTGTDVWTVPASGGPARRVTTSGGSKIGLTWSPTGTALLTTEDQKIVAINPSTGTETAIGKGDQPAWSPDGTRIAYVDTNGRVAVMNADGSSSRELTTLATGGPHAWSPDGSRVAFTGFAVVATRSGRNRTLDLYTAPADGSAPPRRLTGPFDPRLRDTNSPRQVAVSADGALIAYRDADGNGWVMNADGSCARALLGPVVDGPFWRPDSTTGGPLACVDLVAYQDINPGPIAPGKQANITITIENHGNQPAHNVVLHIKPAAPQSNIHGCGSRTNTGDDCLLGTLDPGGSLTIQLAVSSPSPGQPGLGYSVSSTENDLNPSDNYGAVFTTVRRCTTRSSRPRCQSR